MSSELTKHLPDIRFMVVAEPHSHYVEFAVYDVIGYGQNEEGTAYDVPCFQRAGSSHGPDTVETIEESQPFVHGSVKWDGCSNWHFDEQDSIMIHGCCREDIHRIGIVLASCWDWAAELMPDVWLGE